MKTNDIIYICAVGLFLLLGVGTIIAKAIVTIHFIFKFW